MFVRKSPVVATAMLLAMLSVSACSGGAKDEPKKETGTLVRTLEMVDDQNRHYGTVELSPIGGGKVYDASGRVIGEIVAPGHSRDHDDDDD